MLTALGCLPSIRLTVYRGVKLHLVDEYPVGQTFVWWCFSPCTSSVTTLQSEQFLGKTDTRIMFIIDCCSGNDIRRHSYFETENEVLLPAARQFKIVGYLDSGNDLHIIQLQETEALFHLIELVPKMSTTAISHSNQPEILTKSTQ
ncbi:unnamed protein product [Rotaria socialis]|uniref:NAD(P)(+)--arginine ADP-ribosyltransferase n=1 Tax=Rotaria socialis TaxID=392032 RepID=A0A821H890_9BILA|nr:unnamed protein product [Rotaria socialis]CAF3672337.1 unnamed protein product [Rotaria socialis]CAF3791561.1 unnamed protein product [Rotaria socialis]CAF4310343.1 unnamed protein product [Rotaria socialis]CAF4450071.1 unnamed protein product [Rotaria socialis]